MSDIVEVTRRCLDDFREKHGRYPQTSEEIDEISDKATQMNILINLVCAKIDWNEA